MAIERQELLRRLSFIKYLYTTANEQADKPDPLCNVSILLFHDAIELFLQLACEYYNIEANKTDFMGYFILLKDKMDLTQTETMRRFNKARINLKHHGNLVSKIDLESFKILINEFFIENTKNAYEIDFDTISLVDLITYKKAKEHLTLAENYIKNKDYSEAIIKITIAFWDMIVEYKKGKIENYGKPPVFFFSKGSDFRSRSDMIDGENVKGLTDYVTTSIEAIDKVLNILTLGINYQKFIKFDLLTPIFSRTFGGAVINKKLNIEYNNDNVKWCFDFVIECCIKLQENDYIVENLFKTSR